MTTTNRTARYQVAYYRTTDGKQIQQLQIDATGIMGAINASVKIWQSFKIPLDVIALVRNAIPFSLEEKIFIPADTNGNQVGEWQIKGYK